MNSKFKPKKLLPKEDIEVLERWINNKFIHVVVPFAVSDH